MKKEYSVLLVDDHPLICGAYESALLEAARRHSNLSFTIKMAHTLDDARYEIQSAHEPIGLFFLDISLPASSDKKLLSGEDLGLLIKQLMPEAKIIVATTFNDNFRMHNIFKNVDPDGFLIKNDVTPDELISAILTVLNDPPYYSKSVVKLLRKQMSNEFTLDKVDRQLLYEISIGTKTKDLPDILNMSMTSIEKRKRHLKEIFGFGKGDDRELILNAKERGFI